MGQARRAGLVVACILALASNAAAQPGDPASRLPGGESASEFWDLIASFESGERIFARFMITNEGPGRRTGVTLGHVVGADGTVTPFRKGKREGQWQLSPDGRDVAVGSSALRQRGEEHRFEFESQKQGVEIELRFAPAGPVASRPGSNAARGVDALEIARPVTGWYQLRGMAARREVSGTLSLTHHWMTASEADLTLRRIEFISLGDGPAIYLSQRTAPDGGLESWLAIRNQNKIIYNSNELTIEVADSPKSGKGGYPIPAALEIHGPGIDAVVRVSNILIRHDMFEALPLAFRLWLSLRTRPHRVWTESSIEVKLRSSPDTSPLEFRGMGITSVTFLNPLPSPA